MMSPSPHVTLAEVADEFADWRQTRTRLRTPPELQKKVMALLSSYRVGEVLKALNLSHKNVMAWKRRWTPEAVLSGAEPGPTFLPLPGSAVASAWSEEPRVYLKLSRHQGAETSWSIEAELSADQWPWALSLLHSVEAA
jgi:hypothetical protein